jgi:4-amino-4-deoxy-L-arabinose transferase-like glycosyltransferase
LDGFGFTFPSDHWPATRAGEPTAHWSYLYTLYLSLVYGIRGANPLAARLIQAVIAGLLQPWLTWRLARRVFGRRVAFIAAMISALYVYFVYYGGALMTETFFILAVLWVLDLSTKIIEAGGAVSPREWMLLGLAVGAAVLLRQVFLLFAPFLLGWLIWHARQQGPEVRYRFQRSVTGVLLVAATLACLVLPWTVRNYLAFGRFALLNSSAGFAFFWANHPIHQAEFIPILLGTGPSYGELIPRSIGELNEVALDQELLHRGFHFVQKDPIRYLQLSASRAKEYFKFWPSSESSRLSNFARVGSFGVLLPFALVGLAVGVFSARAGAEPPDRSEKPNRPTVGLLYLFIVVFTLIHLLSWSLVRYRLPVDAILVIFASSGVLYLATKLGMLPEHQLEPAL